MGHVTGIGGLFFRAKDPGLLAAWYARHLGIMPPGPDLWQQQAGGTVFTPFAQDCGYFEEFSAPFPRENSFTNSVPAIEPR